MEMCPRRAQPRWQMRETMVAPAQANTRPIGSRDGLPGTSGDPMGCRYSSVPAPFPSPSPQNQWQEARGRCGRSQSGSTGSARGHTQHAERLPLHTHSHRGTRQPHRLDVFPSPNLSLLIHKMGTSSRPFLTRVGRHPRGYALGREALGPGQMWDCGEGSGCTSGA